MRITRSQEQKLERIGKKYKLKLILLHGSYAKGEAVRGRSDLDIAVMEGEKLDLDELLGLHSDLAKIFGDSPERDLDLKTLSSRDPLFVYEVASSSQLLYGDQTDYDEYCAYAFRRYHDARDLFELKSQMINKFQKFLNTKYA